MNAVFPALLNPMSAVTITYELLRCSGKSIRAGCTDSAHHDRRLLCKRQTFECDFEQTSPSTNSRSGFEPVFSVGNAQPEATIRLGVDQDGGRGQLVSRPSGEVTQIGEPPWPVTGTARVKNSRPWLTPTAGAAGALG